MGKILISKCCHAEVRGDRRQYGTRKIIYTCSKCHYWPCKVVLIDEDKNEREKDGNSVLKI